jgi:hypothetical protein
LLEALFLTGGQLGLTFWEVKNAEGNYSLFDFMFCFFFGFSSSPSTSEANREV